MYEVVVLAERALADVDARVLRDLFRDTPERTHVHLLLPAEEGAGRVEGLLSVLSTGRGPVDPLGAEPPGPVAVGRIEAGDESAAELARSLDLLRLHGLDADGETVPHDPLSVLDSVVASRGSNEVVIMTRTHIVAETLHTDWTSRARRELGVPVLHLLEQAED